jgi:hypothetical protein
MRQCIHILLEHIQGIEDESQQVTAVQGLLNHPAMAPLAKMIGYIQEDKIKVTLIQY